MNNTLLPTLPVPRSTVTRWYQDFSNLPIRMPHDSDVFEDWSLEEAETFIDGILTMLEEELVLVSDWVHIAHGIFLYYVCMQQAPHECTDPKLLDEMVAVVYQAVRNLQYVGERMRRATDEDGKSVVVFPPKVYTS